MEWRRNGCLVLSSRLNVTGRFYTSTRRSLQSKSSETSRRTRKRLRTSGSVDSEGPPPNLGLRVYHLVLRNHIQWTLTAYVVVTGWRSPTERWWALTCGGSACWKWMSSGTFMERNLTGWRPWTVSTCCCVGGSSKNKKWYASIASDHEDNTATYRVCRNVSELWRPFCTTPEPCHN